MLDPHDDTDVPSGTTDGAQMERTLPPACYVERGLSNCGCKAVSAI